MKLAVIPARGGSKRIPHKNIRMFCGKPMLAWSVEAAKKSACFDRIIVSTDDEEIAAASRSFGAETPFMRPEELSDDHAGTIPVVAHAIQWQITHGEMPDMVCCIYATAPFIRSQDIRQGFRQINDTDCEYAFSATTYAFPIQRAFRILRGGGVDMLYPQHFDTRSQDLETVYHDAGQFYWGKTSAWLSGKPLFAHYSSLVILPRHRVQDIDTQEDWEQAEFMFKAQLLKRD
jgi:N-acylneuraminate cytidylyltransferase